MDRLFQTIRESCSANIWSRGVALVRQDAVHRTGGDDNEIELRVAIHGELVSPLVSLFVDDEDWTCECSSREDVCAHVAAAAIAMRRGLQKTVVANDSRSVGPQVGQLGYRLLSRDGQLEFHRSITTGEGDVELTGTLAAAKSSSQGPSFVASQTDLRIEVMLGSFRSGPIPQKHVAPLLRHLSQVENVRLDDRPIDMGQADCGMALHVESCAAGIRVQLRQAPGIDEFYKNGALRRGQTLHALAHHGLNERLYNTYRQGHIYSEDERGELFGRILPEVEDKVPVVMDIVSAPQLRQERPYVQINTTRVGNHLDVLPILVYGDPPLARVDGDQLKLLGKGPGVRRDLRREERLLHALRGETGLACGVKERLDTQQAMRLVKQLSATHERIVFCGSAHHGFFDAGTLKAYSDLNTDNSLDVWFEADDGPQISSCCRASATSVAGGAWMNRNPCCPLEGGGFAHPR
ncbi:MAG: hypothetical protein R3C68_13945 [Myxococcota bacterium]